MAAADRLSRELIARVVACGLDTTRSWPHDLEPIMPELDHAEQSFLWACSLIGRRWHAVAQRRLCIAPIFSDTYGLECFERTYLASDADAMETRVVTLDFRLDREVVASALRMEMERPGFDPRAPIDVDADEQAPFVADDRVVAEQTQELVAQMHLDFVIAAQRLVALLSGERPFPRVQAAFSGDLTGAPGGR